MKDLVIKKQKHIRWMLLIFDALVYTLVFGLIVCNHVSRETDFPAATLIFQYVLGLILDIGLRLLFNVYSTIWRYGSVDAFLNLILGSLLGGVIYFLVQYIPGIPGIDAIRVMTLVTLDLLIALIARLTYIGMFRSVSKGGKRAAIYAPILKLFGVEPGKKDRLALSPEKTINIAIIGGGRIGVALSEQLIGDADSVYVPVCIVEKDASKIGRDIYGIPVVDEERFDSEYIKYRNIQELVLAFSDIDKKELKGLYEHYKKTGCKVKVYDYPTLEAVKRGRRAIREFTADELLFRAPVLLNNPNTVMYYEGKTVLVTGGGGSIGSELVRQLSGMKVGKIIVLDIAENGAYDVSCQARGRHPETDISVEIVNVCDEKSLEQVFVNEKPDIVIHAAAHKHVPLMEHNVCEAIRNNVFGTLNTLKLAKKHGAERFMLVSTDKAVNPTNVMGATKRMCEMLVLSHGSESFTCTATRFGNVLGSAGSVIPLFKRQIEEGGPITLTDKRIIRFFMTIPEAAKLVLTSGAMAKDGQLMVLDMGEPVKIADLAENMVRLAGLVPYKDIDIVEKGLRPGEKLYEELLIKGENLTKTADEKIFIETDEKPDEEILKENLERLYEAAQKRDDDAARIALKAAVPTYKDPEEYNKR